MVPWCPIMSFTLSIMSITVYSLEHKRRCESGPTGIPRGQVRRYGTKNDELGCRNVIDCLGYRTDSPPRLGGAGRADLPLLRQPTRQILVDDA